MSAKSPDAESRDNSPDHEGSPGKRPGKKRKVLSCYACRNRKMKCDRVFPVCGRCQKTGRAEQCTYDPRLLEDFTGSNALHVDGVNANPGPIEVGTHQIGAGTSSLDALQWKARIQERRILELESKLAAKESSINPSYHQDIHPQELNIKEEVMFRGKGFKTSFHGTTSIASTISQYREMQAFTRVALTVDHSIMRIKSDFRTFRDRRKIITKQMGDQTHGTDDEIFAALPQREQLDAQISIYFDTCETTYRIIHQPTFLHEYHEFWKSGSDFSDKASFAVMLILITAITKCLNIKDDFFDGDTSVDRRSASILIETCDVWLTRQSRKRMTVRSFQLQCLSFLAKKINSVQVKQEWIASGDLMRLALAAGLHRNVATLGSARVTSFEMEWRSRIWATIVELELQSSLDCGRPSSLTALYWDAKAPTNIPDEAFLANVQEVPAGRTTEHFTSTSYLCVSRQSLPLRIHLAQILNDPSEKLEYADVLHYDSQIHEALSNLPSWKDTVTTIASALLLLQLRQFLLLLHKPYARMAHVNQRYMYSLTQCVDTAGSITAMHEDLTSKGILVLNHLRNDAVRVALSLSEVTYHNCAKSGPIEVSTMGPNAHTQPIDSQVHFADLPVSKDRTVDVSLQFAILPREPFLVRTLCTSAIEILEQAVQVFEQKIMRLGTGYMEYWLLSSALGMLPGPSTAKPLATSIAHIMSSNDDIQSRCKKTLDRFQTLTFRVLAMQQDPGTTFAASLRTTMSSVSPSEVRTPSVGAGTQATSGVFQSMSAGASNAAFSATPGIGMGAGIEPGNKEMSGTYDNLQDMGMDIGGWNFPEFWAFDLEGDF